MRAAFSPDGRQVLTGSSDKTAVLRDVQSGKTIHIWRHDEKIASQAFSPDGRQVLTGWIGGAAILWDVQSGKRISTWLHDLAPWGIIFSPDSRYVLIRILKTASAFLA